jgi:DNA-binding transcriptional LysR family regulator
MQLQLPDIALFLRIVQLRTLSAAARERDVPVSQVTRALLRLEAATKARLMHRSTHNLSLTAEGERFLVYAQKMVDCTDELAGELNEKTSQPRGKVRVSTSSLMAECLIVPSLSALYQRYPELQLDIRSDDRIVDMARDGIDIAIRTGENKLDTLVVRRLGQHGRVLCASHSYVKANGKPKTVDDLGKHHLIGSSSSPALNRWQQSKRSNGANEFLVKGHTLTDNSNLLHQLVLTGIGIARLNDLYAQPLIRSGQLVPLLSTVFPSQPIPISAAMLQEKHRLPKIRACVDFWAEWLNPKMKSM